MVKSKENRFAFGENWQNFLQILSEDNILEAEKSLTNFLNLDDLHGKRFLDIGSGSGLHSLVARRMGAEVFSFDYDVQSVECTQEIKRRYFCNDTSWTIEQGSILDRKFIDRLGKFDISYAWGVLHHTGALWQALYNAQIPLCDGGLLFVAIYNDQGIISVIWKTIKKIYCSSWFGSALIRLIFYPVFFLSGFFIDLVRLQNPLTRYSQHKKYRGMSLVHDWRDWLGGYPFEPAEPEKIINYYKNLGFELLRLEPTEHGFGNNQFLFRKTGIFS